jgi:hypothetical protein
MTGLRGLVTTYEGSSGIERGWPNAAAFRAGFAAEPAIIPSRWSTWSAARLAPEHQHWQFTLGGRASAASLPLAGSSYHMVAA